MHLPPLGYSAIDRSHHFQDKNPMQSFTKDAVDVKCADEASALEIIELQNDLFAVCSMLFI